jgi:X-X-X-Leu-X-X-Gly heptad repeat protein
MLLRRVKIGTRLAFGFGAIVLVMVLVSVGGMALGTKSRDELGRIVAATGEKQRLAAEMRSLVLEQSATMRNIGLHADLKAMQMDEDRAKRLGQMYDEARARMGKLETSPAEREILDALRQADSELNTPLKQAMAMATSFRNEDAAQVIMNEIDPIIQKELFELTRLVDMQKKASADAIQAATVMGDRLAATVYVVNGVVFALAFLLAWAITRSIGRPLAFSVKLAQRVAGGDLSADVRIEGRDEATELLAALREMNEGLSRIVVQIRSGAEQIAVGAGQVAAGNQQLSSRTEEHASSLEETASTLEEFTTTVRQNAERAGEARDLAAGASRTAEKGGEIVGKVVSTMQEVSSSSKRISDIIGVIDGISFQTNILALNAAVEAARAGEQGRGFAVVASEVRSLAQRSAASAKEIRGLIENSVGRIESGARLVEQAGETMGELVGSVRKVAQIVAEIAAASHEQSSGIEQINKAITQMDTVVQMNASLVEEATAAATSMAHQATALARSVAQFQVRGAFEGEAGGEPQLAAAVSTALPHEAAAEPRAAAIAPREPLPQRRAASAPAREPALADADEWKEF